MIIDGVKITAEGFNPSQEELKNYVDYVRELVPNVDTIQIVLCEDGCVDLKYTVHDIPFERIRRITGYLVGTIDRWNDAKKSEEQDRFKHVGGKP